MFEAQARRCVSKAYEVTGSNAGDAITTAALEPKSKKRKLFDGVDDDVVEDYDELFDGEKVTYETNSSIFVKQLKGKARCNNCCESEKKVFRFSSSTVQATSRFFAFYVQGMCTCGVVGECLEARETQERYHPDPQALKVDAQIAKDNGDNFLYKHLIVAAERIQDYINGNHSARIGYEKFPLA